MMTNIDIGCGCIQEQEMEIPKCYTSALGRRTTAAAVGDFAMAKESKGKLPEVTLIPSVYRSLAIPPPPLPTFRFEPAGSRFV